MNIPLPQTQILQPAAVLEKEETLLKKLTEEPELVLEEVVQEETIEETRTRIMVNPRTNQRIEVQVDENNWPIPGTEREI